MIRITTVIFFFALATASDASEWTFAESVIISSSAESGVFHHLESSGRKNISVHNGTVAVTWEDNHQGRPAIYVAFKRVGNSNFSKPIRISSGREAYEPVITSIDNIRFLVAWEQDNHIWARTVTMKNTGRTYQLDTKKSAQVSLARGPNGVIHLTWSRYDGRHPVIVYTSLKRTGDKIITNKVIPVEPEPPKHKQTYPGIVANSTGVTVAWEDRRHGHTKLYYSHRSNNAAQFSIARQLNESITGAAPFGRGPGVTRVALTSATGNQLAATWMDKRDFHGGYDIYASVGTDGGTGFGPNEKAQDIGGENIPQWHPTIAMLASGLVVIAWDDTRDDTSDIWLSWRTAEGWSDDFMVEPASGDGEQNNPAICFDSKGTLHIAWINKQDDNTNQLMYASGTLVNTE